MSNPEATKNPHAVALGRIGGKAAVGDKKRRGDAEYYRQLGRKSALVRRLTK